jgi:hypothetical protein
LEQVGSFVDGSEKMGERNSHYLYLEKESMFDLAGSSQLLRTVLVETNRCVSAGETILVFYGSDYFKLAPPEVLASWKPLGSRS